jgi:hypothetical protein
LQRNIPLIFSSHHPRDICEKYMHEFIDAANRKSRVRVDAKTCKTEESEEANAHRSPLLPISAAEYTTVIARDMPQGL